MTTDVAMLDTMMQRACRLADVYGARAEQCEADGNREEGRRWFELFERGFFAFRVGLALKLRMARDARAGPREPDDERVERLEAERPEAPERLEYTERDRDRDTERASFPLLLKTLGGLVADAEAMPGPPPAELLDLKELLTKVAAAPAPKGQPQPAPLKARLTGSTAAAVTLLERPKPPPRSALLPIRRATGPPKR